MSKQPNIIFFTWHDAGRWFGCYGHDTVQTPNVDRLAAEGVRFTNFFSACAICSPSRAAMMTGTHCQKNGVMGLTNGPFDNRIYPHIPHMAARFKEMGYRTALFGVQHECAHEHVSEVLQVDERYATDPWPNADLTASYMREWIQRQARQNEGEPFYAQVGTIDSHLNRFYSGSAPRPDEPYPPLQDATRGIEIPGYLEGTEDDYETVATLQGLLQRGDRLMGAILDSLEESGLAENTLVIMCVDHGVGLTRAKGTCYDPGSQVSWIMRQPGTLPAGKTVDALCTQVDVLPTLWELLGEDVPEIADGTSLARHVLGQTSEPVNDAVHCFMTESTRSIRTETHKLIRNFHPSPWSGRKGNSAVQFKQRLEVTKPTAPPECTPSAEWPAIECYDLREDPLEMHNLAGDSNHGDVVNDLDARLWEFLLAHNDFVLHEPVRTPWQVATREALVAHCRSRNRTVPTSEGPLHNAIDAATARGCVIG